MSYEECYEANVGLIGHWTADRSCPQLLMKLWMPVTH